MKKIVFGLALGVLIFVATRKVTAQAPSWESLASRIVNETASVKPGERVVVQGGKHTMVLMEQIAAELHRKGAHPLMITESDVSLRALWHEKPMANLADYPSHILALFKEASYVIGLPDSENFKEIYQTADPKRSAAIGSISEKLLDEMSRETNLSSVYVNFPNKKVAEVAGLDVATYEKMHWAAVNTNYAPIRAQGEKIMALLKGAKQVRITTREGTDLTFSMGDRLVFADDGVLSAEEKSSKEMFARFASLPGGWMDFAPLESSVNGKVVIPQARCDFEPMKGIAFEVKNGVMQNFTASHRGDCYEKEMAPHTGAKSTVSIFTIGLNPEVKVIQNEKTDYRENIAAGYISLAVGGNNRPYRGAVAATGGFTFPLVNATLQIDGAVVIKDGKLQ